MKRFVTTLLIALVAAGSLPAQVLDKPVAIVRLTETVNIGQRELRTQVQLLEQQLGRELSEGQRREVLEAQIGEILISQAAARLNFRVTQQEINNAIRAQRESLGQPVSDSQFRQFIQEQLDLTWEEYVEQITERLIQEKYVVENKREMINNLDPPGRNAVLAFYEENATQFTNPAMVRFNQLFIDTRNRSDSQVAAGRDRAEQLRQQLRSGQSSFQELMNASLDDASYQGGDFGFLLRNDPEARNLFGRRFVESVFSLDEGEVSSVIESNIGFHIVEITNRRSPRVLGLGDPILPGQNITVRDQIENYLMGQQQQRNFQRAVEEVMEELREEAEVELFEQNLDW
ncbi:MAG: peptidylprolyl isomerase [Alkalispirochaetaceae bacterium]